MADDRSSKWLKPTSGAIGGEESQYDDARIVSLESANHTLLSENARLR